ncbi:MAG: hypothetical protein ACLFRD_12495 [Nitriliruptoraceae bacterium]
MGEPLSPDNRGRLQALAHDAVTGAIREVDVPQLGELALRALDALDRTRLPPGGQLSSGRWRVEGRDDHGTRFPVVDGLTHREAEQVVAWLETTGHGQTYQIVPSDDPERWGLSRIEPVEVEVVDADRYLLRVTFEPGGFVREVDLSDGLWGAAFETVRDPDVFAQVSVDPDAGTIVWPNGADWSSVDLVLRSRHPTNWMRIIRALAEAIDTLAPAVATTETTVSWLLSPQPALDGRRPIDATHDSDHQQVVTLARQAAPAMAENGRDQ